MSKIDLDRYFARIGYRGDGAPTLATLRALHALHPAAITFENLDPLLGVPVNIDLAAIADKLIARGRGGYCYEQNTLFEAVLRALGFTVSSIAARVQWSLPAETIAPRYHMVLRVDLPEGPHIADTGFGRLTLTAPLKLAADIEQQTPHGVHRLVALGDDFQLQVKLHEGFAPIYQLSLEPREAADWEVANWYTATSPKSVFTTKLMAARPVGERRYTLLNNDMRVHFPDGRVEKRTLANARELAVVLEKDFAIRLSDGGDALWARIFR